MEVRQAVDQQGRIPAASWRSCSPTHAWPTASGWAISAKRRLRVSNAGDASALTSEAAHPLEAGVRDAAVERAPVAQAAPGGVDVLGRRLGLREMEPAVRRAVRIGGQQQAMLGAAAGARDGGSLRSPGGSRGAGGASWATSTADRPGAGRPPIRSSPGSAKLRARSAGARRAGWRRPAARRPPAAALGLLFHEIGGQPEGQLLHRQQVPARDAGVQEPRRIRAPAPRPGSRPAPRPARRPARAAGAPSPARAFTAPRRAARARPPAALPKAPHSWAREPCRRRRGRRRRGPLARGRLVGGAEQQVKLDPFRVAGDALAQLHDQRLGIAGRQLAARRAASRMAKKAMRSSVVAPSAARCSSTSGPLNWTSSSSRRCAASWR